MNSIAKLVQGGAPAAPLTLSPLNPTSLRDQAYALLKNAIAETDMAIDQAARAVAEILGQTS